jgi:hypothetical protein
MYKSTIFRKYVIHGIFLDAIQVYFLMHCPEIDVLFNALSGNRRVLERSEIY